MNDKLTEIVSPVTDDTITHSVCPVSLSDDKLEPLSESSQQQEGL